MNIDSNAAVQWIAVCNDCHSRGCGNPGNLMLDFHFHGNDKMENYYQECKKTADHL